MAATTLIPIDVDPGTSYRPGVDSVDGVIEERNLGQNHPSAWLAALLARFRPQASEGGVRVGLGCASALPTRASESRM